MAVTILRPSYFMEVWLSPALGFDFTNRAVTIYGSGEGRISWISLGDVAEFAVRSVGDAAAGGTTIELGGPDALSPLEVVRIFEEVGGAPLAVQHLPEEALRQQQASATDSLQQAFAALMLNYARGDAIPMEETLGRYPVRLTSVRDYAASVLRA
jgi:NADH dehydrogenase